MTWNADKRLNEFAADPDLLLTEEVLTAARTLLDLLTGTGCVRPGIFPDTDGEILIEWSSADYVTSISVCGRNRFELMHLPGGVVESHLTTHTSAEDCLTALTQLLHIQAPIHEVVP